MQHSQWAAVMDILLVTLDVTSLYTNIPQSATYDSVLLALRIRGDLSDSQLSFLAEIMSLILFQNYFMFDQKLYHQIPGVAMGATCTPSVENLFMGTFEEKWILSSPYQSHIKLWCLYIDDIFMLWKGQIDQLDGFLMWLNHRDDNIRFTHASSGHSMTFLDVEIKRGDHMWITSVYR